MLTDRAKQLIPKSRIVSFSSWKSVYPDTLVERFQAADDQGRYLNDDDFEQLIATLKKNSNPQPIAVNLVEIARFLRGHAEEIVTEAREKVLGEYPGIIEVGGDLYPPIRAQACWRDFWHFLRCITYGIAGGFSQYTSEEGLHYMELLYEELQVPLGAMVSGLEGLKVASLNRLKPNEAETISPYFDHLIYQLRQFNSQ